MVQPRRIDRMPGIPLVKFGPDKGVLPKRLLAAGVERKRKTTATADRPEPGEIRQPSLLELASTRCAQDAPVYAGTMKTELPWKAPRPADARVTGERNELFR